MSSILGFGRTAINVGAQFFNQPVVKEGLKNVFSVVTVAFGFLGAYDLYQTLKGRNISSEKDANDPKWLQVASKIALLAAKVALILSAFVSRPGVIVVSFLVNFIVSPAQLERVFGPNTIYAINPLHPRHLMSFVAAALAVPLVVLTIIKSLSWVFKKVIGQSNPAKSVQNATQILSDSNVLQMTFFNAITSRPMLHLGNRITRIILLRI